MGLRKEFPCPQARIIGLARRSIIDRAGTPDPNSGHPLVVIGWSMVPNCVGNAGRRGSPSSSSSSCSHPPLRAMLLEQQRSVVRPGEAIGLGGRYPMSLLVLATLSRSIAIAISMPMHLGSRPQPTNAGCCCSCSFLVHSFEYCNLVCLASVPAGAAGQPAACLHLQLACLEFAASAGPKTQACCMHLVYAKRIRLLDLFTVHGDSSSIR
jgi:hypothetical protein